jgi:hypothetical protein
MHIRTLTASRPVAKAYNLEAILDIVLQFIIVLEELENFLGIDIGNKGEPAQ